MTLDDALNELGIDRETDADGARRAYLRLLKKRKPEVDRDGFMRLREAYERAKPYFDQIEMFRAIEKAASAEPSTVDGAPELVRLETPAGIVWVQTSRPPVATPDKLIVQDKPVELEDKPPVVDADVHVENVVVAAEPSTEQAPAIEDAIVEPEVEALVQAPVEPAVDPMSSAVDAEPPEPSIDELIAAGKLKKAARRMGQEYRVAMEQGTIGVPVSAPHQAVLLLLRLHEKNRVAEAKELEKQFAEWLSSTGASVRIMAGPMGVMWMMARELGAVSKNFPPELREGIAKSVIAGKLDDAQRRAGWYQLSDPDGARNAALDLHAHAPSLAGLLGETLAPTPVRTAPAQSSSRGSWGYGIVFVMLLNLVRVFVNSPSDRTTSYRGQADPGAYDRPKPPPSPASYATSDLQPPAVEVKMDKAMQDKLVKLAHKIELAAEKATLANERWVIQRARYVRAAMETGSCNGAAAEMDGFYTRVYGLSNPLRDTLVPNVTKLDPMFRLACGMKDVIVVPEDGGINKP